MFRVAVFTALCASLFPVSVQEIKRGPRNQAIEMGKGVTITCQLSEAIMEGKPLKPLWKHKAINGTDRILFNGTKTVTGGNRMNVTNYQKGQYDLHIHNVRYDDSGVYMCVEDNDKFSDKQNHSKKEQFKAELTVFKSTVTGDFTTEPNNPGQRNIVHFTYEVSYQGNLQPSIQWILDQDVNNPIATKCRKDSCTECFEQHERKISIYDRGLNISCLIQFTNNNSSESSNFNDKYYNYKTFPPLKVCVLEPQAVTSVSWNDSDSAECRTDGNPLYYCTITVKNECWRTYERRRQVNTLNTETNNRVITDVWTMELKFTCSSTNRAGTTSAKAESFISKTSGTTEEPMHRTNSEDPTVISVVTRTEPASQVKETFLTSAVVILALAVIVAIGIIIGMKKQILSESTVVTTEVPMLAIPFKPENEESEYAEIDFENFYSHLGEEAHYGVIELEENRYSRLNFEYRQDEQ